MQEAKKLIKKFLTVFFAFYLVITLLPAFICFFTVANTDKALPTTPNSTVTPPEFLESAPPKSPENAFTLRDEATGESFSLTAEELIPAAVACEMDADAPEEALKAQAVACYTFFCRKKVNGDEITCDRENRQVYTTEAILQESWGEAFDSRMTRLKSIAKAVAGETLTYNGSPILAAYFAVSNGSTEAAGNVWQSDLPYLCAVASPGDVFSDGYLSTVRLTEEAYTAAASQLAGTALTPEEAALTDMEYTPSGYVRSASIGKKTFSGQQLRNAFSLRSADFQLEHTNDEYIFTVRGWGHGVGMSQAGALFMAKRGAAYDEILAHYYPNTVLTK